MDHRKQNHIPPGAVPGSDQGIGTPEKHHQFMMTPPPGEDEESRVDGNAAMANDDPRNIPGSKGDDIMTTGKSRDRKRLDTDD